MGLTRTIRSFAVLSAAISILAVTACGQNRARQMVPTMSKKNPEANPAGANSETALSPDRYNPSAGNTCVRENCPTVDIQVALTGPMSKKVNGFIAEAGQPVKWAIEVQTNTNRRMAIFPDNTATLYPINGAHIQSVAKPASSGGGFTSGLEKQGAGTGTGTGNTATSPLGLAASSLPQQNFSAFKIDWQNPGKAEGMLTFTVRDLSQCEARSKDGAQALCAQFNTPSIVDRSVDVPFKVDKGILVQTQSDEGSLWETLAGCLVTGVLSQADIDPTTGAVIRGVVRGAFGKNNSCYGGVSSGSFYQDDYRNGYDPTYTNSRTRSTSDLYDY